MEHTLHSSALVLLISRSQSDEQSNRGVCDPPLGRAPFTLSSGYIEVHTQLGLHGLDKNVHCDEKIYRLNSYSVAQTVYKKH